jgi:hypothetical protein
MKKESKGGAPTGGEPGSTNFSAEKYR